MKHFKLILWSSVLVAACLPAQAQDFARFKVPFDFNAGGKHFTAGEYKVSKVLPGSQVSWIIQNVVSGEAGMFPTNSAQSPLVAHKTSMVFHSNQGHYSLYQFWLDQYEGRVMQKSRDRAQYNQVESAKAFTVVEITATSGN